MSYRGKEANINMLDECHGISKEMWDEILEELKQNGKQIHYICSHDPVTIWDDGLPISSKRKIEIRTKCIDIERESTTER